MSYHEFRVIPLIFLLKYNLHQMLLFHDPMERDDLLIWETNSNFSSLGKVLIIFSFIKFRRTLACFQQANSSKD